jgi:hypothetical protein
MAFQNPPTTTTIPSTTQISTTNQHTISQIFQIYDNLISEEITSTHTTSTYARRNSNGSFEEWTTTRPRGDTNPPGDTEEDILERTRMAEEMVASRGRAVEEDFVSTQTVESIYSDDEDSEEFEQCRAKIYNPLMSAQQNRSEETLQQHLSIIENAITQSAQARDHSFSTSTTSSNSTHNNNSISDEEFEFQRAANYNALCAAQQNNSEEQLEAHIVIVENAIDQAVERRRRDEIASANLRALEEFRIQRTEKHLDETVERIVNSIDEAVRTREERGDLVEDKEGEKNVVVAPEVGKKTSKCNIVRRRKERKDGEKALKCYMRGGRSAGSEEESTDSLEEEKGKKIKRSFKSLMKGLLCMAQSEE